MSDLDKSFQRAVAASKKGKTTIELGDEILKIRRRLERLFLDWKNSKYGKTPVDSSIERQLDSIAETSTEFGGMLARGDSFSRARLKAVRKALGYTYP